MELFFSGLLGGVCGIDLVNTDVEFRHACELRASRNFANLPHYGLLLACDLGQGKLFAESFSNSGHHRLGVTCDMVRPLVRAGNVKW